MIFIGHPWLNGLQDVKIPLDMIAYKLVKAYICASSLRKAALGVCIISIYLEFAFNESFGHNMFLG